ncbi:MULTISPECIES: AraC family transcriptional regulator [Ensifer]|uniref:AraC family transcriptional regulator n=1 Tax=Ensifer TaxID=106591 RepID=UPI00070A4DBD|nr:MULTISPECIES: AraC family transcriptional regulator [Ensifer]KQW57765.1 AraC family transcriptional regulator [Ensifer sp. Root1252]KQW79988.1 AraC family transcriptional regulator [Ensifer sp. Root127]KRC60037.1 AraC family transcriptional regulator [Ensifer sp. Root231]KRC96759.1 AraC family transcriptional regulator [Ensifer sp. Root258]NOV17480.1 AraC family transcriptional regulator [Ensifer canadensis]
MRKALTQASYNARMNRVIDHVYAHLEEDISFDELADVACLSSYHWSRIYSAMRGETIASTIRRLRLQRAADRLANSDLEVRIVADRAGYASVDTFGRAFKDAFGMTPAAYRENGPHDAFRAANAAGDTNGFPVSVVTLPERRCASIAHRGSYMEIDRAMARLFTELAARGALPDRPEMIGVFFDDPDLGSEQDLRSRASMPIAGPITFDLPLTETVLRGGPYARLSYTGPYAAMRGAYRWFLGVWLPGSGHEPDDAPVFEDYLNDPRLVPQSELRTDIHLPLKSTP